MYTEIFLSVSFGKGVVSKIFWFVNTNRTRNKGVNFLVEFSSYYKIAPFFSTT